MKCKRVQRFLPDYIGEEIAVTKRWQIDQHLKECPDCRDSLGALQEVWDGLAQQPIPQKDEQFWEKLTRGVMQEIRRKRPMPPDEKKAFLFRGWRVLLPAAVVIALIVGVIALIGGLQGPADRGLRIAQEEGEALVEAAPDLSFGPLALETQDPLGGEMTLHEVSLVAEALSTSLQSAEITDVLTQLYNDEDLYGQLEGLTQEELDAFYQLLSSKYPYS